MVSVDMLLPELDYSSAESFKSLRTNLQFCGDGVCQIDEFAVVCFAHVGEPGPHGDVGTMEGILGHEVDMVGDNHHVAYAETGVCATGCIADKECLDAQQAHDTDGEGHLCHGIAFVIVEAPVHGDDFLSSQLAEDELALVALHGRYREVGYLAVGDGRVNLDFIGQMAQTGA